jgi:hypothetical protein
VREGAIVLPLGTVIRIAVVLVVLLVLIAVGVQPGARQAIARVTDPRTTASQAALEQQRTATEHAVQRGYLKATGQLAEVRKLTLAIPASQAASIGDKALADLRGIRHDALTAVGSRLGLVAPQLDAYVTAAEAQLGENAFADDKPILLAPDLYAVVARADDLFQRAADAATRELTKAPSAPPPTPSATPRSSPSGSPAATPSASPTGR